MTQFLSSLFQQAAGTRNYLMHVQHQETLGTAGGALNTGSFGTQKMTNILTNEIDGASLSSNQITLPAGEYFISTNLVSYRTSYTTARLQNITTATTIIDGLGHYSVAAVDDGQTISPIGGKFTLASTSVLEIQRLAGSTSASNTGNPARNGLGLSGSELYSDICIWKTETSAVLPVYAPLLHVEDQRSSGTHAGSSISGSYLTRVLNTVVTNQIEGSSLGSSQITLPAGKYAFEAISPFLRSHQVKVRLRNISDSVDIKVGISTFTSSGDSVQINSTASGEFTLSESKTLELQYQAGAGSATNGLGNATSFGDVEVYTIVKIWKIS